jgi:hypothetical protein
MNAVEHPETRCKGLVALGESLGDRGFEIVVGVGIALQYPDIRRIDRQQQVVVGLQMKRTRIGRRRDEVDGLRLPGVADIGDGEAVAEHMADKGMALVHHDLHAVAATSLIGMADEFDVVRGNGVHRTAP